MMQRNGFWIDFCDIYNLNKKWWIQQFSDQEMENQQIEDIIKLQTHRGNNIPKEHLLSNESVLQACQRQSQRVLHDFINESIQKLLNIVRFQQPIDQKQKGSIYNIQLKRNQMEELPLYLTKLKKKLLANKFECGQDRNMKNIFNTYDGHVLIQFRKNFEGIIQDIAKIQEDLNRPDFRLYVYVITKVSNLTVQMLQIFQEKKTQKSFIVFMPSFQPIERQYNQDINQTNVLLYSIKMLDQKVLLSKYIYKCIVDPKIKAYKPNEILVLIKDMEIQHLSYSQCCQRFEYCLQKMLEINPTQRLELSCDKVIQTVEQIMNKKLSSFYVNDWFNIHMVILNEESTYKISSQSDLEIIIINTFFIQTFRLNTYQKLLFTEILS